MGFPGEEALQPAALLFDYGGTLDADGVAWRDRFWRIYRAAGLAVDESRFRAAFFHADDALPERFPVAGLGLRETLAHHVALCCHHLGWGDAPTRDRLAAAFEAEARAALAESRALLGRLRRRHRIGVVSNFYGNLSRVLADVGLDAVVDVAIDSGVVGVKKPDARLFLAALERLGIAPQGALMIGDSLERDMAGARAAGIPHLLLAGVGDGRRPCCPGDGRIERLADLEPWLAARATGPAVARAADRPGAAVPARDGGASDAPAAGSGGSRRAAARDAGEAVSPPAVRGGRALPENGREGGASDAPAAGSGSRE